MKGLCKHDRVVGHVCMKCDSGTAEDWAEEIMGTDTTKCTGNSMEMSDCFLHDQKCPHRGCEGLCKDEPEVQKELNQIEYCDHGQVKAICLDCAYPDSELDRVKKELAEEREAYEETRSALWNEIVDIEKALLREKDAHGETKKKFEAMWEAKMHDETVLMRCVRAFEHIHRTSGDMLDEEKRLGPGMRNLQTAKDGGGCLPDAAEEKEVR